MPKHFWKRLRKELPGADGMFRAKGKTLIDSSKIKGDESLVSMSTSDLLEIPESAFWPTSFYPIQNILYSVH